MSALPPITVQVAFANAWADTAPTWVTCTAKALKLSMNVGRQQETNQFQGGTANIVFRDEARELDPSNPSSAHYPNVVPDKRLRAFATISATDYPLYDGYITTWPFDYDSPADATISVPVADVFKSLGKVQLPDSPYEGAVRADTPSAWYRLSEQSGVVLHDSSNNGLDGTAQLDMSRTTASGLVFGTSLNAMSSKPGYPSPQWFTIPPAAGVTGTVWSIEFVFQHKFVVGNQIAVYQQTDASGNTFSALLSDSAFTLFWSAGGELVFPYVNDGKPHDVVIQATGTVGRVAISVDGHARQASQLVGAGAVSLNTPVLIQCMTNYTVGIAGNATENFVLSDLSIYPSFTPNAFTHWSSAFDPRDGDTTGARIGYALDLVGFPSARRNLDTGVVVLGPSKWGSQQFVLSYLQTVEATENGEFFYCPTSNILRFLDRNSLLGANTRTTTSQATFSDDGTIADGTVWRYEKLVTSMSDQLIYNHVDITWDGGTTTSEDLTSQALYGVQTLSVTTVLKAASEAKALGDFLLAKYKNPVTRITEMVVNPTTWAGTGLYVRILTLRIGDRITLRYKPQRSGTATSQDFIIEGWNHDIDPESGTWITTYKLRSVDASYWILGTSQVGTTATLGL